jgi:23S rRNA pseudouridine1911/1915/1917 synthase
VSSPLSWAIPPEEDGNRLDRHLAKRLETSRHQVQRWIAEGRVQINGSTTKAATKVEAGDNVVCTLPTTPENPGLEPEDGPLSIIYEDPHLVVLNKASGVAVHPGAGRGHGTLANFLLARYPEIAEVGGAGRPGIVHRIDLNTTGLLVVARSVESYYGLTAAFTERQVGKTYQAIAYGTPKESERTIDLPIGRHRGDRKKMAVRRDGRPATSRYRCLEDAAGICRLEIDILTGRTHQIRVHMKALGHPLVGDPVYGEARWRGLPRTSHHSLKTFPRPALHAWRLAFTHPVDGQLLELEAPVPDDIRDLWTTVTGQVWKP